jgi:hypothetical protein
MRATFHLVSNVPHVPDQKALCGLDNMALFIIFSVAEYLSVYCPLVHGVYGCGEDVEPYRGST